MNTFDYTIQSLITKHAFSSPSINHAIAALTGLYLAKGVILLAIRVVDLVSTSIKRGAAARDCRRDISRWTNRAVGRSPAGALFAVSATTLL
jgi:hypothetical protein